MDLENLNKLKKLSNQVREKIVDIQQEISQSSSYIDPSYQQLMKEAFAIQQEWKQLITMYFICAVSTLVTGLCIWRLIGELGIFIAVPLTLPVAINFGWQGLRLLLQGDPLNEYLDLRYKKCKK